MSPRVLLTRASGRNESIAARFLMAGIKTLSVPLLRLTPRSLDADDQDHINQLDRYDHIVFVSQTAVDIAMPLLRQVWSTWPERLAWYAVGSATARQLIRFGINPFLPQEQSSAGLLGLPSLLQVEGQKILLVRGRGGLPVLRQGLGARGAQIDCLDVYVRDSVTLPAQERAHIISLLPLIILIHSGETLTALTQNIGTVRSGVLLVVPSQRIANLAASLGFDAYCAEGASDDAMVGVVMDILNDSEYWHDK